MFKLFIDTFIVGGFMWCQAKGTLKLKKNKSLCFRVLANITWGAMLFISKNLTCLGNNKKKSQKGVGRTTKFWLWHRPFGLDLEIVAKDDQYLFSVIYVYSIMTADNRQLKIDPELYLKEGLKRSRRLNHDKAVQSYYGRLDFFCNISVLHKKNLRMKRSSTMCCKLKRYLYFLVVSRTIVFQIRKSWLDVYTNIIKNVTFLCVVCYNYYRSVYVFLHQRFTSPVTAFKWRLTVCIGK